MLYKFVKGRENIYGKDFLISLDNHPQQDTIRNSIQKMLKKDVRKFSYPYKAIDEWNVLSKDIMRSKKHPQFYRKI